MDGNPRAVINCWRNANNHTPTAELVADRTFHHAVLTRLRQTERPLDLKALAAKLLKKASKTKTPTSSKGMNGVTLDQKGKASLESLVLHYAKESPGLFPQATVQIVRRKLSDHNGPKFHGPWP